MNTTIGDRIKSIRDYLKLTQSEFGAKLGVSYSAIGLYENGKRSVPDTVRNSICREFNVNRLYLIDGVGEMFSNIPETILNGLAMQFDLNEDEKMLVSDFCNLRREQRKIIMNFFRGKK